jgi:hypothetical protein
MSIEDKITAALKTFGASEAQIADALFILPPLCAVEGDDVVLSRKWLETNKPHMIAQATSPTADLAFLSGNITARGALSKSMSPAALDALAQSYGLKDRNDFGIGAKPGSSEAAAKKDRSKNPWSKVGWNISAQGQLVRAIGEAKAGEIAASVGCRLGSTKAHPDYS